MTSHQAIPTSNTIMPRHLAAVFDNTTAMVLGLVAVKTVEAAETLIRPDNHPGQLGIFVGVYLGYFFLFELAFARTPGKLLTGLTVVRTDGSQISARDVMVRTVFRLLEVNPAFLGYAPAAISIIFSRHHQRLADRIAGTIVVPPDRLT